MPKYSFECPVHGEFEICVPVSQYRDHWPCPHFEEDTFDGMTFPCGETTLQTYTPSKAKDWAIKPVVVHVDAEGNFRLPGHSNARVPKGFEKVELKTLGELEKFERKMNQRLSAEAAIHNENEERHFEQVYAKNRSDLRQAMQRMSPLGRDFAQLAMAIHNARKRKSAEVGFHIDILHNDNSQREAYRDELTNWKPVRWV